MTLNQLAVMTQNGMEIAEALDSVAEHCEDDRLADSIDGILEGVGGGSTLSVAVSRHGEFFPVSLAPMLAAAEATGTVPQTLAKVCTRMRDELRMQGTIVGALVYPGLLIATSMLVLCALILGVLPQFGGVFESMGREVPGPTAFLLSVGETARAHWMIGLPVILGTVITLFCIRKHPVVVTPIFKILMHGPMIKSAYRPLQTGRTFRTMAAMIDGGVPFLEAVVLTRRTTNDPSWTQLLFDIEDALVDGRSASEVMLETTFLPPEAAALVATGERSGRLASVLEDVGSFYEEEAARKIKRLITMFEPMIILGMGVIVAGIVLSVMLPLMDVSTIR